MVRFARLVVVAVGAVLLAWWWRLHTETARMAVGAARASWPTASENGATAPSVLRTWVPPADDGSCPVDHPVKVKESSGIFHPPGGRLYERTRADRCYLDAAAAAADGFRRSQV